MNHEPNHEQNHKQNHLYYNIFAAILKFAILIFAAKKITFSLLFMILAGLCLYSLRSRVRRNLSWKLNIVEQLASNQRLPEPSRRLSENPVKNYVTISPLKLE